jgi:hypothetical protein
MKSQKAKEYIKMLEEKHKLNIDYFIRESVEIAEQEMMEKAVKSFRLCCFHRHRLINKCSLSLCECHGDCDKIKEFINQLPK